MIDTRKKLLTLTVQLDTRSVHDGMMSAVALTEKLEEFLTQRGAILKGVTVK